MSVHLVGVAMTRIGHRQSGRPGINADDTCRMLFSVLRVLSDHVSEALAEFGQHPAAGSSVGSSNVVAPVAGDLGVLVGSPLGQHLGLVRAVEPLQLPSTGGAVDPVGADDGRPIAGRRPDPASRVTSRVTIDVHLSAHLDGDLDQAPDAQRWRECADVLCRQSRAPAAAAASWIIDTLRCYPGCLLAASNDVGGRLVVGTRGEQRLHTYVLTSIADGLRKDQSDLFASFLHGWLTAGYPLPTLRSVVLHAVADLVPGGCPDVSGPPAQDVDAGAQVACAFGQRLVR
jgi:hypothetical protein